MFLQTFGRNLEKVTNQIRGMEVGDVTMIAESSDIDELECYVQKLRNNGLSIGDDENYDLKYGFWGSENGQKRLVIAKKIIKPKESIS